jgi:tetratricopeptide (TPR) repeat protein
LEAEELVSQFNMQAITDAPEPEPVVVLEPEPEPLFQTGPLGQAETPVIEEFEVEPAPSGPADEDQLESARSALEIGDVNTALEQYTTMLQAGQGVPMVIADLEAAATKHTKVAPLQRLLGDAYMQNGQLQKAIDTYRQALDNL